MEFFRRHGLSGRYLGIDVVPGADWERYAATPSPLEASYRCGPIETVPLPEAAFDLVLSSSALEHVEDDRQAVRRIFAATRPGGSGCIWCRGCGRTCCSGITATGATAPAVSRRCSGTPASRS